MSLSHPEQVAYYLSRKEASEIAKKRFAIAQQELKEALDDEEAARARSDAVVPPETDIVVEWSGRYWRVMRPSECSEVTYTRVQVEQVRY